MGVFDGGGTTAPATYPLRVHDIDNRGELASVLAVVDQDHTADLDKPCERLRTANGGKTHGGSVRACSSQWGAGRRGKKKPSVEKCSSARAAAVLRDGGAWCLVATGAGVALPGTLRRVGAGVVSWGIRWGLGKSCYCYAGNPVLVRRPTLMVTASWRPPEKPR